MQIMFHFQVVVFFRILVCVHLDNELYRYFIFDINEKIYRSFGIDTLLNLNGHAFNVSRRTEVCRKR